MTTQILVILLAALMFSASGCVTVGTGDSPLEEPEFTITPDDPTSPQHIRFDVAGTPYATLQDSKLPLNERIRLGMRRFAGEKLARVGYCPDGFNGPDIVLTRNMSKSVFFFVDCQHRKTN